ncbi:MAG TPA: hypothetical protein VHR66_02230 [Gemmataceae bacterium]|jgi:hypothetical protein|nr:hypothetical protein [Gemmataceae bacterium]
MTATATMNGKPRKQLADQLDRLDEQMERHDAILDALAEGLNGAVTDATREGTRLAVKDAVIELLTDPELRAALHQATASTATAKVSLWSRLRQRARDLGKKARALGVATLATMTAQVPAIQRAARSAAGYAGLMWRVKKVVLVGLGVGAAVAAVSYLSSHGLAATLSGVGAAVTTVAIQTGLWVRRTVRRLVLV